MLLRNLEIQDFRGVHRFRLNAMGRVNLLVGTNNSGKTTVLEAIDLLTSRGDVAAIRSALTRRGETLRGRESPSSQRRRFLPLDIKRLFRGHTLYPGDRFEIRSDAVGTRLTMTAEVREIPSRPPTLFELDFEYPLWLRLAWSNGGVEVIDIPIDDLGGAQVAELQAGRSPKPEADGRIPISTRFVTVASLSIYSTVSLFEQIVLTPEEDLVTEALRFIEPTIERLASVGSGTVDGVRPKGGILVRMKGVKDPVPIGSMGDGIWRMLGLALSVVGTRGGVLLVDEIDTGLHYTVMRDMWRFLYQCAKRYDVQVVATTHSWDCCQALAAICREDVSEGGEVTLSRIERDREEAVSYSEQEIIAVAERDIEVR